MGQKGVNSRVNIVTYNSNKLARLAQGRGAALLQPTHRAALRVPSFTKIKWTNLDAFHHQGPALVKIWECFYIHTT